MKKEFLKYLKMVEIENRSLISENSKDEFLKGKEEGRKKIMESVSKLSDDESLKLSITDTIDKLHEKTSLTEKEDGFLEAHLCFCKEFDF